MAGCKKKDEKLWLYLDRELGPVEAAGFEKHLKSCAECAAIVERSRKLEGLFEERQSLYKRHADLIIDCTNRTHEHVVRDIIAALGRKA